VVGPVLLALGLVGAAPAQSAEVIAEIRVHGNLITPEDEILRLADVRVGMPFDAATTEQVAARLRAAKRFESVEVLKRFASISDPNQIVLVIMVDDGRVALDWSDRDGDRTPRVTRRRGPHLMFLPILDAEDGYGLSYGVRFAVPNPVGSNSRLSFPLAWGGQKRAGAELERYLDRGPFTRVEAGASISRRKNPFFEQNDDRGRVWFRADRELTRIVRASLTTGWDHVSFLGQSDSFSTVGAAVELDTRLDPMLARNAVYARAAWDHFAFGKSDGVNRASLETRGYLGLVGQSVLVMRALREDSDRPLPPYLRPLLGGMANLRGFRAGSAVGDTLVAGSAELRLPLTSPLSIGKLGVSAFVDTGAAYDKGQRLGDQRLERGVGGSVWFAAAFVRLNLAVAHGIGASTRVHFGTSLTF
jgi:outer membrane protein assembly factor BamA